MAIKQSREHYDLLSLYTGVSTCIACQARIIFGIYKIGESLVDLVLLFPPVSTYVYTGHDLIEKHKQKSSAPAPKVTDPSPGASPPHFYTHMVWSNEW